MKQINWWIWWALAIRPYESSLDRCASVWHIASTDMKSEEVSSAFQNLLSFGGHYNIYTIVLYVMHNIWNTVNWICTSPRSLAQLWYFLAFYGRDIMFVCMLDFVRLILPLCSYVSLQLQTSARLRLRFFFLIHVSAVKAWTTITA